MMLTYQKVCVVGLIGLAAAARLPAEDPALPVLSVPVCSAPPKVDGVLDDACWKAAAPADRFHIVGEPGVTTAKHKAYVTRDSEWLYVGFEVSHPVSERNPPTYRKHDENVQRENNVQVSFDPGTGGDLYYQFLVNPANVRADFRMTREKGRERENWNIPWRSATREGNDGWSAELALPLCLLLTHGEAAWAKLNLIVVTFAPVRDQQAVQLGVRREKTSWAPLRVNFNEPDRFGLLRGLEAGAVKAPFLPYMTGAKAGAYRVADGRYFYDVTVGLQALSGRTGTVVVVVVDDKPEGGPGGTVRQAVALAGYGSQDRVAAVPVESLAKRTADVALVDAGSGEVWQRIVVDDTSVLDLFGCYLDRNYYTTEAAAQAVCRIGLPAEGLQGMRLRVKGADGQTLAEKGALQPNDTIGIPLDTWAAGEHKVAIELCQADGTVATRQELTLVKRTPKPGCEWKIDRVNRVLLKNGEPFFPYGFIMGGINPKSDWAFKDVGENGFNSVVQWSYRYSPDAELATDARAYLDAAAARGLQVVLWPDGIYWKAHTVTDPEGLLTAAELDAVNATVKMHGGNLTNWKSALVHMPCMRRLSVAQKERLFFQLYEKQLPRFLTAVANARDASNLIGYYLFDEPLIMELNQDVAGRHYDRSIRAADGYHPTFLLYSSEIPESRRAVDWCDSLGTDPYWIPAGHNRATVNWVSKIVANTKRRADEVRAVTFTVPMAEYWSGCRKRSILPGEQRCQTYLALIHGSKAIWYFIYPVITQSVFDEMKVLAGEMKILGPICLMPDVDQQVTYSPGVLDPINDKFTDVQVSLKRRPEGGLVLLAANTTAYPVDVTYRLSCLGATGEVGRLFDLTRHPVKAGQFSDRLAAFDTRAYRIEDAGAVPRGAIAVAVSMQPHPEMAQAEAPALLESSRAGKKNLLPNSSFEQATVRGWPDYYRYTGTSIMPNERIGSPTAVWGVDTNQPYHGRYCLRMDGGTNANRRTYFESEDMRGLTEQARPFVLSLWMRASRDGVKTRLRIVGGGQAEKEFSLTTTWQRYALPVALAAQSEYFLFWVFHDAVRDGDTVWMDAIQFEAGDQPTDYEP